MDKGKAYTEPNPISDEERALQMGEEPPEEKDIETKEVEAKEEGTGTLAADEKTEVNAEDKAKAEAEAKTKAEADKTKQEADKLTEDEKKDIETQGFKIETDKRGFTYVIDKEGTKIREKRFGKFYREGKEAETLKRENEELKEKQTLLKQLGADEYYKLYPDEAPAGYKPPEARQPIQPVPAGFNVLDLPVKGGQYDGQTLREVMAADPDEGTRMLHEWTADQYKKAREQEDKATRAQRESEDDAVTFGLNRAKELFGTDNPKDITPEQNRKILLLGQEVLDWQTKNNRLHLSFEDAYKIMKHDDLIKKAREEGSANALKALQKQGPASIDTGTTGGVKPSGWEEVASMNDKDFEKHIDSLDDKGLMKFLKEAPASVRAKHPDIDWRNA